MPLPTTNSLVGHDQHFSSRISAVPYVKGQLQLRILEEVATCLFHQSKAIEKEANVLVSLCGVLGLGVGGGASLGVTISSNDGLLESCHH